MEVLPSLVVGAVWLLVHDTNMIRPLLLPLAIGGLSLLLAASTRAACDDPPAPRVNWRRCLLDMREFPQADLTGAVLRDASLRRVQLTGATLTGVDAVNARFVSGDLSGADLTEAVLRDAEFMRANLRGAKLQDADLRRAGLFRADLREADLTGAALQDANLTATGNRQRPRYRSKKFSGAPGLTLLVTV
jgi:uncharacterized protein YjbI with pentapeptide repeats